ncbi:MAG: peptidoglycan DD-metalloendopeptidase family protein [Alphaproteobacteria bacterium]|nr:peptidoglycan DD-metalloendopeptidase family protein [Alphaproteobacteria bacterium]MBO4644593.1 peptidoglycan DD-metalloendopeptidase family protein [Alphaproteobacteria bacterium]
MALKRTTGLFCFALSASILSASFSFASIENPDSAKSELSRVTSQIEQAKKEHKQLREKAQNVQKEILDVRKKMVAAAGSIQEQEESLNRLEQKLAEFEMQQSLMKKRLDIRKAQRMHVLGALQSLAFKPTEALLAQPLAPQDTLRSALLLREAVPRLEFSTEGLRKDLNRIASLTTAIRAQYAQIKTMAKRLDEKRRDMNVLIKKKSQLQTAFASESSRAKARAEDLAKQAGDLKELLAKLEADSRRTNVKRQEIPTGAFMSAKGRIPYPVKGTVVKTFGEKTETGVTSKGITIATRANAQVISPYDGTVLFAGPFRGYGQLVIIEHGDGYHTLLAGIGRLDTSVGQSLLAGEPVGIMVAQTKPTLYIELRKNGQPINPAGWLSQSKKG